MRKWSTFPYIFPLANAAGTVEGEHGLIPPPYIYATVPKNSDFVINDDCIGKILSTFIINNLYLFETLIFEPMKINFNLNTLDLCWHYLAAFLIACKV